jgi:hypothetical protein
MPLSELADKVLASGYRTKASNFKNVLYQSLYKAKHIRRDKKTGNYLIKQRGRRMKADAE